MFIVVQVFLKHCSNHYVPNFRSEGSFVIYRWCPLMRLPVVLPLLLLAFLPLTTIPRMQMLAMMTLWFLMMSLMNMVLLFLITIVMMMLVLFVKARFLHEGLK